METERGNRGPETEVGVVRTGVTTPTMGERNEMRMGSDSGNYTPLQSDGESEFFQEILLALLP